MHTSFIICIFLNTSLLEPNDILRDQNHTSWENYLIIVLLFSRFLGNFTVNAISSNTHTLRYFLDPLLGAQTYDLSDMFMMAKIRCTDKDDNQIADNTEASIVNDCLFSALKSMKVFINDKPIVSMPHFGYQQYFSKKLSSDITAIDTYLTTEGYFVSLLVQNYLWMAVIAYIWHNNLTFDGYT